MKDLASRGLLIAIYQTQQLLTRLREEASYLDSVHNFERRDVVVRQCQQVEAQLAAFRQDLNNLRSRS
jgi:hypothetical protein